MIIAPPLEKGLELVAQMLRDLYNDPNSTGEQFDYGAWVHDLGQKLWAVPVQITEKITKAMEKK